MYDGVGGLGMLEHDSFCGGMVEDPGVVELLEEE